MTRSYVTNLRKGRIETPGYEKLAAIAKAMGFPPEEWFEKTPGDWAPATPDDGLSVAGRVQYLFETIRHPNTDETYTDAQISCASAEVLVEGGVEGIRTGKIADPTVGQVVALAAAFGVPPSYLFDRGKEPPIIDEEALGALADETASAILRESAIAPEGEGDRARDRAAVRRPARRT